MALSLEYARGVEQRSLWGKHEAPYGGVRMRRRKTSWKESRLGYFNKSYMFGDNRSVDTSSTIPNSTISKRHHLASYHRVREAIAAKYISFHWKDGKSNPADILSKHWEFATVWPMLKPILFWRGETATQLKGSDRIPSTTPGAEPPRDAKDSGSARSHSTHLETSSSDRP